MERTQEIKKYFYSENKKSVKPKYLRFGNCLVAKHRLTEWKIFQRIMQKSIVQCLHCGGTQEKKPTGYDCLNCGAFDSNQII